MAKLGHRETVDTSANWVKEGRTLKGMKSPAFSYIERCVELVSFSTYRQGFLEAIWVLVFRAQALDFLVLTSQAF